MQVYFVTSISERPLGTKCLTFSEIIHEFCLRFAMVPDFVPSTTHGYQLIFSPLINIWDCPHLIKSNFTHVRAMHWVTVLVQFIEHNFPFKKQLNNHLIHAGTWIYQGVFPFSKLKVSDRGARVCKAFVDVGMLTRHELIQTAPTTSCWLFLPSPTPGTPLPQWGAEVPPPLRCLLETLKYVTWCQNLYTSPLCIYESNYCQK